MTRKFSKKYSSVYPILDKINIEETDRIGVKNFYRANPLGMLLEFETKHFIQRTEIETKTKQYFQIFQNYTKIMFSLKIVVVFDPKNIVAKNNFIVICELESTDKRVSSLKIS